MNATAMVILLIAALGIVIAVRGTQDNLLSAVAGHQVQING